MSSQETKKETISTILINFKNNLFGIEYYFDKFGSLARGTDIEQMKKSSDYITDCFTEIGIDIKTKENNNTVSNEKLIQLSKKLTKQPKISSKNYEILSKSSFLMLNNYFEYLLSDLLSYHYNKFQKSLNEKKFNLALKEINEYETIDEVTKALITKEVETMMVEMTFDELLEHFHTTLEINNEKDIINWDLIRECRERRHLIVHNSSLVNKKYISRTKNPFNLKIGETIYVTKDYFIKSCREFYLAGILMSYNCWGKWDKDAATEAIYHIMVDSFELLKQNDYDLVCRFTNYSKTIEARNEKQEDYLLRTNVNRLIALKKLDDTSILSKELKKFKTGTISPIFKLAFAILSDNHKNIIDLVKQAKSINELDFTKYQEWPIYDFIRNTEELNNEIEKELNTSSIKKVSKATNRTKKLKA